jgi:hypothetical protein
MKSLFIFLFAIVLFSCNTAPDNKIYSTKVEKGDWVYDSVVKKPVQQETTFVEIRPTLAQSFAISSKRNDRAYEYAFAGFALLLFIVILIGVYASKSWLPRKFESANFLMISLFILLACMAVFILGNPVQISGSSYFVDKNKFDSVLINDGNINAIWVDLQDRGLIINAAK